MDPALKWLKKDGFQKAGEQSRGKMGGYNWQTDSGSS